MSDTYPNIKLLRLRNRYPQKKIAKILDTTQQQYWKYENGVQEIPVRHVITLSRFYNVSLEELLGLSPLSDNVLSRDELRIVGMLRDFDKYLLFHLDTLITDIYYLKNSIHPEP